MNDVTMFTAPYVQHSYTTIYNIQYTTFIPTSDMSKWQICRFSHISGKVNNSYKLHSHQFSWKLIFLAFSPGFFALSKIYHFWSDTKNIFISAKREKAFAIWWKTSLGNCSIFLLSSEETQNILCFWVFRAMFKNPNYDNSIWNWNKLYTFVITFIQVCSV